ncbi:selenoneine biosynthesis selenosugar synthase SenB [Variovorax sp. PCZ-1]|uniref:selenoneine biosynthesis selenosugar synthase SenB n=1 Tax=Variovorax sp. PCZ-1 TaxID=2835533 RepID=UPI001BCBC552|nr:selenoneine biosynthesis selenosugar synthase SenB [Variovorax sp. PCZ-1]MBS7807468.1 TIGR04348 family glycosyltransferase [Variovorax sp. PCZ-1]
MSSVVIISPALSDANNGNWQTAKRWAQMLSKQHRTRITKHWQASDVSDEIMIALHARRSADSIAAWHALRGSRGLIVALTGTDLYRDIQMDTQAQASLDAAGQLIVLQELGINSLPKQHRGKTSVVFQSTTSRKTLAKTDKHLNAVMVGHLRDEKMPQTLFEAARLLKHEKDIRITHIGAGLDEKLAQDAINTEALCAGYIWARGLKHAQTRQRIQRAHVLVHTSKMEGGAHVIMEAVCSGTPVLASRMDGNVGMLGGGYDGYFPVGDASALAALLRRCKNEPTFLDHLSSQCALRAPLFSPLSEQTALLQLVAKAQ